MLSKLTPAQRRCIDQIVSVFENDTITIQYGYSEILGDGRGITAGKAGFTSATGDLLEVVERYADRVPATPLARFLPRLRELAQGCDDATVGLEDLPDFWAAAADDPVFRAVQDEVIDELYYQPALAYANRLHVNTALGLLILYDTIIQHGDGDDPDGLPALLERTHAQAGGSPATGVAEPHWLATLLARRREVLLHPDSAATQAVWAESVKRCDALRQLLEAGHYALAGPLKIAPFGTLHEIS